MNIYYIDENLKKNNTAGAKAPDDIATICKNLGFRPIVMPMLNYTHNVKIKNFEITIKYFLFLSKLFIKTPKESIIIYQHPTHGKRMIAVLMPYFLKIKHLKIITIIHDLESLRGGINGSFSVNKKYCIEEMELLKLCDCIISHNRKMTEYLQNKGIVKKRLIELEIFDYLSDASLQKKNLSDTDICIAGNLAKGKCSYIYKMFNNGCNQNIKVNLYGNNYEEAGIKNLTYKGSFSPDVLPELLIGKYGLVWDGNSPDTCAGNTGEYLKYNNPHKTSLYFCAGIPVIIWEKAAMAEFVLSHKVGISINSLYEIQDKISQITEEDYLIMKQNVERISKRLRSGYYLRKALKKAINIVN